MSEGPELRRESAAERDADLSGRRAAGGVMTDAECLARLAAGELEVLAELLARYQDRLVNLIYRLVRDWDTALDLGQEVFVRIHERAATFRPDGRAEAWIFTVAVNLARDHLRRQQRIVALGRRGAVAAEARRAPRSPSDALEQEELRAQVWRVLGEIPEGPRTLLLLRDFEEFAYEDLAVVLDCDLGTVKSRLHRARRVFEEHFNALFGRGTDGRDGRA
ncbi:MAG: RNA polymerase sigma factor [Planctomycetota bacterium]